MIAHIPGTETIIIREEADGFFVAAHASRAGGTDDHSLLVDLHASEHARLPDAVREARALAHKYNVQECDIFCGDDSGEWDASFDARVNRYLYR